MLEYQLLKWRKVNIVNGIGDDLLTLINSDPMSAFMPMMKGYDFLGFNILTPSYSKIGTYDNLRRNVGAYDSFTIDIGDIQINGIGEIPIYDCFRLQQRFRYADKEFLGRDYSFTETSDVISNHCSGLFGVQSEKIQLFTAENDCYVEISAMVECMKSDGTSDIFNEQDTNIIIDCGTNIKGKKEYVKAGDIVDYEICLPENFQHTESYHYIRCDVYVKVYNVIYTEGYTSSIIKRVSDDDELANVVYYCENDEFGFPFKTANGSVSSLFPMWLGKPQYNQNDKIYTKSTGENVVLFSEITKEYDVSTDYVSERMHEIMLIALSCDTLSINGERVTKSDKYEVDWDNYTLDENGEKLARATFKVKSNVTKRNSNY